MLQQTPVSRVETAWRSWIERWPGPFELAEASPADVIRAWDRLGYPRRALRLREAAIEICERFDGQLPKDEAELRTLPGIGEYTAAAIRSFAYGKRAVVLDTNVRRVIARLVTGEASVGSSINRAERERADELTPKSDKAAAHWSIAVMELGALVCTAAKPACDVCPVRLQCAWRAAGYPTSDAPAKRSQKFEGTDRQARGAIMATLRKSLEPVHKSQIDLVWHDPVQRERALDSLVSDGLVEPLSKARYRLPK